MSKKDTANQKAVMQLPRLGFSEVRKWQLVQSALFLLVVRLSCSSLNRREVGSTGITISLGLIYSMFTVKSQVCIFQAVLRMPAAKGWAKAFSTYLPHLTINIYLEMANCTTVMEFTLLGYSEVWEWELVHAAMFLLVCMEALMGNLIIAVITFVRGSNVIHQFSWESPHIIKLSQSSRKLQEYGVTSFSSLLASTCFVSIVISYMGFFRAMLRMPAAEGQDKAFSPCLTHLSIITVFVSNGDEAYRKPVSNSHSVLDLLISPFCYGATPRPPPPTQTPSSTT
ncbi:putative olfactory receptor 14L1 [Ornithorhynchus anatinus]|uniref:putative olfactory receptor 14L1 n=1 Tax=Ornithorhynchus anatinus TaxID=9258 RepID=UPI0019D48828|nr:putative olfactory receptor 14L1 [Ornithorhynchus anatinus]